MKFYKIEISEPYLKHFEFVLEFMSSKLSTPTLRRLAKMIREDIKFQKEDGINKGI